MSKYNSHFHFGLALTVSFIPNFAKAVEKPKPNILIIAIDDMNNWVGAWGGQAKTPNIDKLASQGMHFQNAYCVVPACNPSRAALMTGQRPETNGLYANEGNFRKNPGGNNRITIPQYLRSIGYTTVAAGKLFHHPRGNAEKAAVLSDSISWDEQWKGIVGTPGIELYWNERKRAKWLEGAEKPYVEGMVDNSGMNYISKDGVWGPIPQKKEECGDWQMTEFCKKYLKEKHDKPFVLACGIFRPHSPQLAPKEFFDLYPLNSIQMPEVPDDDMDDIPQIAKENWSTPFVKLMKEKGQWRNAVQGYLASMSFADACVGNLMDALDKSEYKDNTIVIFWTDHGWQLGHKNRWEKFSLWQQSTQAPMIMRVPGMKPGICMHAVSFLDIYPTIADLLDQKIPGYLEGHSLKPLLVNPNAEWNYKPVITNMPNNYSVVWKNWNYIRYQDGSEELYDHTVDPKEFKNLASKPEYQKIIDELKESLPSQSK